MIEKTYEEGKRDGIQEVITMLEHTYIKICRLKHDRETCEECGLDLVDVKKLLIEIDK